MYLKSIKIDSTKTDIFNKDFQIDCSSNINILVGDQGVGKSTILYGLHSHKNFLNVKITKECEKGVSSFYFDAEKQNPRIQDLEGNFTNIRGESIGIGLGGAIASRFMSHGEVLKGYTVDALQKAKDCIIFLDEPESALSIKNQNNLYKAILKASKNRCQLFIATHSLVLIQQFNEVFNMENKKWISSNKFIENQMK